MIHFIRSNAVKPQLLDIATVGKMRTILKVLAHAILLFIAFKYFGLPSWERYQDKKVVVTTSQDDRTNLPAPDVTVCPARQQTGYGFPNIKSPPKIEELCRGMEGVDIASCVTNATYSVTEAFPFTAQQGQLSSQEELGNIWVPEFSDTKAGLCYNLDSNFSMDPHGNGTIAIGFQEKRTLYTVFVHDPKYFLLNYNPLMPFKFIGITVKHKLIMRKLVLIQHEKLDLPSKPCNPLPYYSFTACLKKSLSLEIGCRLPWDRFSPKTQALCEDLDQYRWISSLTVC